jgi:phage terminase large subunit-like protein
MTQWKDDRLKALEAQAKARREAAMRRFKPYDKQRAFFDAGTSKRERLFMAGNQLGKSEAGAFEVACHLTGQYPEWWEGRRFDGPVKAWAAGETSLAVRDVSQKKLCGEPGVLDALGTGMIPRSVFASKPTLGHGATDAFDTIQVKHISGGVSILRFKSYEQGRQKFQGETLDFIWMDEEPDLAIYTECLTRTNATNGFVFVTFTPLKGRSDVVIRFLDDPSPDRTVVSMTIEDVAHIKPDEKARIISSYPAHEREARINGTPMLGSGRIFAYSEESISEPSLTYIPAHWYKGWAIDFGIGHPFAAVLMLHDRDNDVIHVHHAFKIADALPITHAARMTPLGINVPVSWPHDGDSREKSSGETLASAYKAAGLKMQPEHATFPEGGYDTEAGILEMSQRMATGRFKVAEHLSEWFEEYRFYHRKDGMIVKVKDDILSATRIGIMDRRHFKQVSLGGKKTMRRPDGVAAGCDFNPWTGEMD